MLSAYTTPNDPDLPQQWAMYRLGLFTDTPLQRGTNLGAWNRCAVAGQLLCERHKASVVLLEWNCQTGHVYLTCALKPTHMPLHLSHSWQGGIGVSLFIMNK